MLLGMKVSFKTAIGMGKASSITPMDPCMWANSKKIESMAVQRLYSKTVEHFQQFSSMISVPKVTTFKNLKQAKQYPLESVTSW